MWSRRCERLGADECFALVVALSSSRRHAHVGVSRGSGDAGSVLPVVDPDLETVVIASRRREMRAGGTRGAIVAVLAADTRKGIASREEVAGR